MRIFCWNVNSLVPTVRNINLKYGSLAKFFQELDADIVCMQEVKLPYAKLTKDLVVVEGYQSYWSCSEGKTGYSGVTTWARHGCAAVTAEADPLSCEGCEKEGRSIMSDHGNFVLFNVYVPNAGDRPERARLQAKIAFLQSLKDRIDVLVGSGRQVIAVGDFNVASEQRDVHSAITWDTLYEQQELDALHALFDSCTDTWRHLHPTDEGVYTVWNEKTSARAFNVGLRIDYALCSKGLLQHARSCEILLDMPPKWSDHAPVLLDLDLPAETATDQASQPHQQQQQIACPMWQQLLKQFADPSQRSIASMFRSAGASTAGQPIAVVPAVGAESNRPPLVSAQQNAVAAAAHSEAAEAVHQQQPTPASADAIAEPTGAGPPLQPAGESSCKRPREQNSTAAVPDDAAVPPAVKLARHEYAEPDSEPQGAAAGQHAVGTEGQCSVGPAGVEQQQRVSPQQQQAEQDSSKQPSKQPSATSTDDPKQQAAGCIAKSKVAYGRSTSEQKASEGRKPGPRQAKLQSFFTAPAKPR